MKTSNKILLTLFILPFVLATLVGFTFYSVQKSGKFITEEQYNKESKLTNIVPAFTAIDLLRYKGNHVTISKSDSFAVVTDEWNKGKVSYEVKDNILILTSASKDEYIPVTIFCPSVVLITTDSAGVNIGDVLRNATINAKAESDITLNSNADSLTLNIERNGSVNLGANTIQKLQLNLSNGAQLDASESTVIGFSNVSLADSAIVKFGGKTMKAFLHKESKTQQ
ncbi:MAG: DUF2807 domain-containing protein [Agriterribacter sp.]